MVSAARRAIHLHGALGVSNEMLFGEYLLWGYALGLADGPSEVHQLTVAKEALAKIPPTDGLFPSAHVPSCVEKYKQKYASQLKLAGHKRGWVD
ncbi:MAG: acyl-CoA dehydrogenase family protein, partial [Gammaproteobacteria bacterium]